MNNDKKKRRHHRRLRYGTSSTVLTAAVCAAVVLLNIIVGIVADRFPITLDLSSNKVYTLIEDSVAIAEGIKTDIEVVVFTDESEFINPTFGATNGVPEYDTVVIEFYNALRQYRSHSGDKLTYSFVNPNQEPAKFAAYNKYEVAEGDILFLCEDRHKIFTLEDLYNLDSADYSTTGQYTFESKVEKVMASTVYNLQTGNEQVVQVLVGHEEDTGTIQGLQELYELGGYTFEELSITGSKDFNKEATVAIIPAPAKDYSASDIKKVQQWLYNDGNYGRHLMVFVSSTANCPNLYEFLEVEYKITVEDELILETDANRIQYNVPYYTMCDVPETEFTMGSVSSAKVFTLTARRLTTTLEEKKEDSAGNNYSVQLTEYPETAELITMTDFDADNADETVYDAPVSEYPLTSMLTTVIDTYNNETSQSVSGTVTVSGCPAMAYADFVKNGSLKNDELLLETINGVTGNETSVDIPVKILTGKTVSYPSGVGIIVGLGVFTVGLPLVILIICLVVFLRRKNL